MVYQQKLRDKDEMPARNSFDRLMTALCKSRQNLVVQQDWLSAVLFSLKRLENKRVAEQFGQGAKSPNHTKYWCFKIASPSNAVFLNFVSTDMI